ETARKAGRIPGTELISADRSHARWDPGTRRNPAAPPVILGIARQASSSVALNLDRTARLGHRMIRLHERIPCVAMPIPCRFLATARPRCEESRPVSERITATHLHPHSGRMACDSL